MVQARAAASRRGPAVQLTKLCTTSNEVLGLEYRRSFRDVIQGAYPLYNDAICICQEEGRPARKKGAELPDKCGTGFSSQTFLTAGQ